MTDALDHVFAHLNEPAPPLPPPCVAALDILFTLLGQAGHRPRGR